MARKPVTLPDWPRGMREPIAAEYVGLSATQLRAEVTAGRLKATPLTPGRIVYLRERLDAWLDAKDGRAPPPAEAEAFDWSAELNR